MDDRKEIRSIAKERGVELVLHFTQSANLAGIVKHGILPRRELEKPKYRAVAVDKHRLDENTDAVSVSISRVNELMFRSKRRKSGHDDWIVLGISPEILWTLDCRFCWCNAARNEIKNHRGWRGGPWAFARMFADRSGSAIELPTNYPTDPEAEVQVLERIAPTYILGAIVNHPKMVQPVQGLLKRLLGDSALVGVEDF